MNCFKRQSHRVWCTIAGLLAVVVVGIWSAEAWAQEDVNITINQVNASDFPNIVTYVTVSDATGLPVVELPPEMFSLFEDGASVKDFSVRLLENVGEPILLALALDTSGSMKGAALQDTQDAAEQLIRSLGPGDQVSLLSFDNDVQDQLDFSNDKEAIVSAVQGLQAQEGGYTALYKAIERGVQLLDSRPRGRKALVVLTDGKDTLGTLSSDQAAGAAQEAGVPIYAIGFGPEIQPAVLEQLAADTGGHFYHSPSSAEVISSFEDLARLLRYQYVFQFQSSLQADDASHILQVGVEVEGIAAEDEDSFVAARGKVVIEIPSLVTDQPVGGLVTLTPRIEAPGEIVKVEYLLDGSSLATVTTGDFSYEWDATAVSTGEHTLTVRAIDSVGNSGETEVTLTIVPAIEVAFASPAELRPVVGDVLVEADISAVKGVAQVEFFVDDGRAATVKSAPWRFMWDTSKVSPGLHTLSVVVYDVSGQSARVEMAVWVGVRIDLPAIGPGARVGGIVALEPQIEAPEEVIRVDYLLDGAPLGSLNDGEFAYTWDATTVLTGAHTLTVRATDRAGNEGQIDISLMVVDPIKVDFAAPSGEERERLAGTVTVKVDVTALHEIARVEFSVDGRLIETVTTLPWRFSWDTTSVSVGRHTLAATAYDVTGQSHQAVQQVWVVLRNAQWGLWAVLAIVLIATGVMVPLAVRKRQNMALGTVVKDPASMPASQPGAPVGWLIIERGPEMGRRWPLPVGETALGRSRSDNDIVVASSTVSRRHALIHADNNAVIYHNLKPTNPTLINEETVVGSQALEDGDRIQIGNDVVFVFVKESKR